MKTEKVFTTNKTWYKKKKETKSTKPVKKQAAISKMETAQKKGEK